MKEIKFRAWDKVRKGFINGFNMFGFSRGQGCPYKKLQRFSDEWKDGDFELQQFTGLKDKNGKEIYEGDILRYYSDARMAVPTKNGGWKYEGDPHLEERTVVQYSESLGAYMVHGESSYLYEIHDKSEVIGNTFENPELMEEWK